MVLSKKYYNFRSVGVTSEVGLTTDRDLSILIFDERPTRRTSVTQGLFVVGPYVEPWPGHPGPVGILLKRSA